MYNSIVIGIDGSPTAEIALEKALELARASGGRVHLVSAYERATARVAGGAPSGEDFQAPSDFKVEAVLQQAVDRCTAEGLDVQQHAPQGRAAEALIRVAQESGSDLIVIGSVGMKGPKRIFGSVPNSVAHRSPCDVLIVQTSEKR
jgi:nucleotide-binding universal stress UspA family protein